MCKSLLYGRLGYVGTLLIIYDDSLFRCDGCDRYRDMEAGSIGVLCPELSGRKHDLDHVLNLLSLLYTRIPIVPERKNK